MIRYIEEDIRLSLKFKRKRSCWIREVVGRFSKSGKIFGEITFVFCSDDFLLKINNEFLKHNYYTDVITFDYCEGDKISGDIVVSVDMVKANARKYGVLFDEELSRVMIHGIFHLLGYADNSEYERSVMRNNEDESLKMRNWECVPDR